MRNQRSPTTIMPLLLPWLGFVALTLSMPACEMRGPGFAVSQDETIDEVAPLEIDAARSEAF